MAKTYLMPGEELTPEQREQNTIVQKEQEDRLKDLQEFEVQKEKEKKMVTIEQLLKTRISPTEDRVVVYPDPVETVTEGGIIKPKEVIDKERPMIGTVLVVGPGKKVEEKVTHYLLLNFLKHGTDISSAELDKVKSEALDIQIPYIPGDRVLYGRFAGTPTEDPDTKTPVLIMRPMDIFAKI